jgi:hypothetical protein
MKMGDKEVEDVFFHLMWINVSEKCRVNEPFFVNQGSRKASKYPKGKFFLMFDIYYKFAASNFYLLYM